VVTVGIVKGAQVMTFILQWGLLQDKLGREPTMEEYAEYAIVKRAQAFRRKALFRECFPTVDSPTPIWLKVKDQVSSKQTAAASIEVGFAPAFTS
jgi:hypothetical protein